MVCFPGETEYPAPTGCNRLRTLMPGKQLIDQLVRDLLRGHDPPLRIMHTQNPGRSLVSRPPQGQGERPSPAVMAATRSDSHALGPRHDSPANPHDRVYEPYAQSIDHNEVLRLFAAERAQLVEVLPAKEFGEEHVAGAINIPLKELERAS